MSQVVTGTESFTNGPYIRPSDGDRGDQIFDLLEDIIDRLANHSHSGADSNRITLNIEKDITTFELGVTLLWDDLGNDTFRAQLSVPTATTYDASVRKFYVQDGAGEYQEFYPTVEKVDANNYYVFSNEELGFLRVITL